MKNRGEAEVKEYSADKFDYTSISFEPDLKKFGLKELDDDTIGLMAKRVYDIAGISPSKLKVFFNTK